MFKKSMFCPWKSFIVLLLLHAGLHGLEAAEECLHQGMHSLSLSLSLSPSPFLFLSLSFSPSLPFSLSLSFSFSKFWKAGLSFFLFLVYLPLSSFLPLISLYPTLSFFFYQYNEPCLPFNIQCSTDWYIQYLQVSAWVEICWRNTSPTPLRAALLRYEPYY